MLIQIPTDFEQQQIIAVQRARIAGFICRVTRGLRTEFDDETGGKLFRAVMSSKPIGGDSCLRHRTHRERHAAIARECRQVFTAGLCDSHLCVAAPGQNHGERVRSWTRD